jgi:hypothetical protein
MKKNIINNRVPVAAVPRGAIKLLLMLTIAAASLPALGGRNIAPVISGTPDTSVTAGSTYNFQPAASDANGNRLKFSIVNKPAWANFSGTTGTLSGTPTTDSAGTYSNIVISVSDRHSRTSLPPFDIQVVAADAPAINHPPLISGTPAVSVLADGTYLFQPTATDADADPLSFTISNKPGWASFSTVTGQLSGAPGLGNVGTYTNIVISVSDGKVNTSLPEFAIEVDAPPVQTGSLTLSWQAPVTRTDGTPLSLADIKGYRIHYGPTAGNYNSHLELDDGTAQQVTLTGIPPGTYYLVMTTYDDTGLESGYSAEVTRNVQ